MENHRLLPVVLALLIWVTPWGHAAAEDARDTGPFARIAFLRPHDGDTVDFEAGYIRHLEWHRRNKDHWVWHGWTIWAGERQRWFMYATFGHSAEELANPVAPAADEIDNISNVTPHAQYVGNGIYKFLPALSRGTAVPSSLPRPELTTVDLAPGSEKAFEASIGGERAKLQGETLWFRLVAGGPTPRYIRLRPRADLKIILEEHGDQALPDKTLTVVARATIEILNQRPAMTYGLFPPANAR